ncbi:MAG: hypothetical protein HZA77_04180 [Candidatus Schekmanbacteria bacterium]|nr:hypothetical protein [Candidatus Schekmanbacteria bacterium]
MSENSDYNFIEASTDEKKIEFFGNLMPSIILLRRNPRRFLMRPLRKLYTPSDKISEYVKKNVDDIGEIDGTYVFLHKWKAHSFDPVVFEDTKMFIYRLNKLLAKEGINGKALYPLSPRINLPKLAANAGLGTLSPFGLLVHPEFGPRLFITALTGAGGLLSRNSSRTNGCTSCDKCVEVCPQNPRQTKTVNLGLCRACSKCISECPVGA